ncbi:MAG: M1 family metallopeptidase [Nocardioidaceae bacterium]
MVRGPASVLGIAALFGSLALGATSATADTSPAKVAFRDPVYPAYGTGAINVRHYGLDLTWTPSERRLAGTATLRMTARKRLTSIPLSLRGFTVSSVTVDSATASFTRSGDRLRITLAHAYAKGSRFVVVIGYAGRPGKLIDPDGGAEGWLSTPGGTVALGEPLGSMTWFPLNNTPSDKASYDIDVTVPDGLTAVSNGRLVSATAVPGGTRWSWSMKEPMAGYLAMLGIGTYRRTVANRAGVRYDSFVAPSAGDNARNIGLLPKIVAAESKWFGGYPFHDAGLIVDPAPVGYALECQTRVFVPGNVPVRVVVHELAHHWFGDSLTPRTWRDIWLNEGFATYAEWLWAAKHGGSTPARKLRTTYAQTTHWRPAPRTIGPKTLFDDAVYDRGAMTLQVLRERIGTKAFFKLLRAWAKQHRHGNVTTAQFKRLAEKVSGRQLDRLFRDWLSVRRKPARHYVK